MSVIFSAISTDCSAGNPDTTWTWFSSEKATSPLPVLHWVATACLIFLANDLNTRSYILMEEEYFGVFTYFLRLPGCFRHPPTATLTPNDSSCGVGRQRVEERDCALELRRADHVFITKWLAPDLRSAFSFSCLCNSRNNSDGKLIKQREE